MKAKSCCGGYFFENIEQKIVAVRVRSLSQAERALVVEITVSVATLLDKLCCG